MAVDKTVELGTVFIGRIDPSLVTAITNLKTALTILNSSFATTATGMDQSSASAAKLRSTYSTAGAAAKKFAKQQTAATTAVTKQKGAVTRLVGAFKTLAAYMVAGAGIRLFVGAIQGGIKEIAVFDQALKNLQAITGATDAELFAMKVTLVDLARTTKFSTTELAEGMVLLGQAGFDAAESMAAIRSVAELATGTLSSLQLTSDLVTTTIRAFNLEAIESGRVADVMANAVNKSKLTIEKLRTAFNYVGAAAAQSNLKLEEVAASMMLLANNGLRASTIGTGFRQVLRRLIAPNAKLRDAFAEQNIALDRVNPSIVGYGNSLKELSKVLIDQETKTVDMGKAYRLFGLRGAQAAAIIIKGYTSGKYQDAIDKVYEVGTASAMAAKQSEGLIVKWKNMWDNIKLIAVALGDGGLLGAFKLIVDIIRGAVIGVAKTLSNQFVQMAMQVGLLTAAIYGAVIATKAFIGTQLAAKLYEYLIGLGALIEAYGMLGTSAYLAASGVAAVTRAFYAIAPLFLYISLLVAAGMAWKVLLEANEKALKLHKQEVVNLNKLIHGYELYSASLKELQDQKKQGVIVAKEESAMIQRLFKEYPELSNVVDKNVVSTENLIKVLDKLKAQKEEERIKNLIEIYDLQEKKVSQVTTDYDILTDVYAQAALVGNDGAQKVSDATTEQNVVLQDLIASIIEQGKVQKLSNKEMGEYAYKVAKASGKSEKFANTLKNKVTTTLKEAAIQAKKFADELEREKKFRLPEVDLQSLVGELDNFEQASFNKIVMSNKKKIEAIKERYRNEVGMAREKAIEIEQVNIESALKVAELGNTELANHKQVLLDKFRYLQEYENKALSHADAVIQRIVQEGQDKKEVLKANYEAALYDTKEYNNKLLLLEKETKDRIFAVDEELIGKRIAYIQQYKELAVQLYQEAETSIEETFTAKSEKIDREYASRLNSLSVYHKQRLNALKAQATSEAEYKKAVNVENEAYRTKVAQTEKLHFASLIELAKQRHNVEIALIKDLPINEAEKNSLILEENNRFLEAQKGLYEERVNEYRSMISQLLGEEAKLANEIRKSHQALVDIQQSTEEKIRQLKRQTMSESHKWDSDKKRALQLMHDAEKAMLKGNYEDAKKYYKKAQDVAVTLSREVKEGETVIKTVAAASAEAIKLVKEAGDGAAQAEKEHAEALEKRMKTVKEKIEQIRSALNVYANKLKELNNYPITINVKPAMASLSALIKRLNIAISKKRQLAAASSSSKTTTTTTPVTRAAGGVIPGIDKGYDSVPALVRPGEWVIKNSAVKMWEKLFGNNFMEGINNPMSALGQQIMQSVGMQKFAEGGEVAPNETMLVRFQAGNSEAPVKISDPDSRNAMKEFARELSKMRLISNGR